MQGTATRIQSIIGTHFLLFLLAIFVTKGKGGVRVGGHASQQSQATTLSFLFWFTETRLKRQQKVHHTSKDKKRKTHQKNCLESKVCPHGSHNRHVARHPWLDSGRCPQVNTAYAGIAHTHTHPLHNQAPEIRAGVVWGWMNFPSAEVTEQWCCLPKFFQVAYQQHKWFGKGFHPAVELNEFNKNYDETS